MAKYRILRVVSDYKPELHPYKYFLQKEVKGWFGQMKWVDIDWHFNLYMTEHDLENVCKRAAMVQEPTVLLEKEC
jgi:hypothetical protein